MKLNTKEFKAYTNSQLGGHKPQMLCNFANLLNCFLSIRRFAPFGIPKYQKLNKSSNAKIARNRKDRERSIHPVPIIDSLIRQ